MPSLKPILAALAVALAVSAANQPLSPASAQVFKSRMDQGKDDCEKTKHGKFAIDGLITSDKYTCTRDKDHKIDHCQASTGKCDTKEITAPKPAAAATPKRKSLLGTGHVTKAELKKICAQDKAWLYNEEKSSTRFSCMDTADGVAINCTKEKDCTEAHTPVHAR
jgi:hypothetical protein